MLFYLKLSFTLQLQLILYKCTLDAFNLPLSGHSRLNIAALLYFAPESNKPASIRMQHMPMFAIHQLISSNLIKHKRGQVHHVSIISTKINKLNGIRLSQCDV